MDIEFRAERREDGGPVLNWIADRAIRISEWLFLKFEKYATVYVMEYSLDEEDEDE